MRIEHWLYTIPLRFRSLFHRGEVEQELNDELQYHIEQKTEQYIAQGMSAVDARRAALRDMDGLEQHKEECRDMRGVGFIEDFLKDVRFGVRQLRRNPGFTIVAVITLALGIGASTAVFSVIDAVVLRSVPYLHPSRLVSIQMSNPKHPGVTSGFSYPNFFDFRRENRVFAHMVTYHDNQFTLTGSGRPLHLDGEVVSWDLFRLLGVGQALGRGFLPAEESAGTHVVVLSHDLWLSRFAGNQNIVGQTAMLDEHRYTIVGVAPRGFTFPPADSSIQLWTTIATDAEAAPGYQPLTEQRGADMLPVIARLKPGVTISQARAELDLIAQALAKEYPDTNSSSTATLVQPELDRLVGSTRRPLMILMGAVGLLLLIACANIASLLLARTATREREIAVRTALGAGRGRVVRQLFTECLSLSSGGSAAGILIAAIALRGLIPLEANGIPRLTQAGIDWLVLAFAVGVAVATAVIFGIVPARQAGQLELTASLKEGSRASASSNERLRGALVVAQITLSLTLVAGAGLLMASFFNLQNSNLGMRTDHLLTFRFSLPEAQYNQARQVNFYDRFLDRLRSLPGVKEAAGVWPLPLSGDTATIAFDIQERPVRASPWPVANMAFVTPSYFAAAGVPLLEGRFFTDRDNAKSPPVVIVDKAFARKFFPGEDPLGKRIEPGASTGAGGDSMHEIVGVVGNTKLSVLSVGPKPIYYLPYRQLPWMPPPVIVRTAVPPRSIESTVRREMAALDPEVPLYEVRTMDDLLSLEIVSPRFHALLLGSFAGIAVLLTMVGLYGVISYSVARRTREIGVRLALGASHSAIVSTIVKRALTLVAIGVLLGAGAAIVMSQVLRSMLYGIAPLNPAVFFLAAFLVCVIGLFAALIPARRATKVDPIAALRHE
jgi:putative ABC transport system permease protein